MTKCSIMIVALDGFNAYRAREIKEMIGDISPIDIHRFSDKNSYFLRE